MPEFYHAVDVMRTHRKRAGVDAEDPTTGFVWFASQEIGSAFGRNIGVLVRYK